MKVEVEGMEVKVGGLGLVKDSLESLRLVRNDAEQIREIDQHLVSARVEIVDELVKILDLVGDKMVIDGAVLGRAGEVFLDRRGILVFKGAGGDFEMLKLVELEPSEFMAFFNELVPKLREALAEMRRCREVLSEGLEQVLDALK